MIIPIQLFLIIGYLVIVYYENIKFLGMLSIELQIIIIDIFISMFSLFVVEYFRREQKQREYLRYIAKRNEILRKYIRQILLKSGINTDALEY